MQVLNNNVLLVWRVISSCSLYQLSFSLLCFGGAVTTSYLRGLTFNNSIIIVDEAQNCNYHELCSIITRIGNFSKFIMCGDYYQSDFTKSNDKEGINKFIKIISNMTAFDLIEFEFGDIVRSGLVRDFIMTKELVKLLRELKSHQ